MIDRKDYKFIICNVILFILSILLPYFKIINLIEYYNTIYNIIGILAAIFIALYINILNLIKSKKDFYNYEIDIYRYKLGIILFYINTFIYLCILFLESKKIEINNNYVNIIFNGICLYTLFYYLMCMTNYTLKLNKEIKNKLY